MINHKVDIYYKIKINSMRSLLRIFKFAIQGFFRNFWLSVVTITMMLMAVVSVTLLMTMDYVKEATIAGVENKIDILVELKSNVSREDVENLVVDLEDLDEIKDINIITPEQNLEAFKNNNLNSNVTDALKVYEEGENPFSYSLAIRAYDLNQYGAILDFVNQDVYSSLVEGSDSDTHEAFIGQVNKIADFINKYSWYITGLFVLISIIVIFNTIRISIYTRKDEIMIMKLVGATNWFVRSPFILESVFYALAAVLIVVFIAYPVINLIQPSFNSYFQGMQVVDLAGYFNREFWMIFGSQFLVLASLNIVSTVVAIRRYLRV